MLRNYLAAALRNLARNRLYAALNIFGLGVGFAAAILVGLYVRHERTFEHFMPGYEGIYRLSSQITAGTVSSTTDDVRGPIAMALKVDFPQILSIVSLRNNFGTDSLRHGDTESLERGFYWADPSVFEVLPLPAAAGDLRTALQQPDSVVLTRRMARKYFGTDLPLGQTIVVNRQFTLKVTAVLEDLPSNTHLNAEIFGSGLALPPLAPGLVYRCFVYMRLIPGADVRAIQAGLPQFIDRHTPPSPMGKASRMLHLSLIPIGAIHLAPPGRFAMKPAGDSRLLGALSLVGLLILLTAAVNYINLMTARASRRSAEVAIRKAVGAQRADLVLQFIGESLLYSLLSVLVAVALTEWLLPKLNGYLDCNIVFDYWSPSLLRALLGLTVLIGCVAGVYPALILSAFRPATVLKTGGSQESGSGRLRELFVLLQFSVLIGLMLVTAVISLQTQFGLRSGLRFDRSRLLSILVPEGQCERSAFADSVRALPGVLGAACSMEFLLNYGTQQYRARDGREVTLRNVAVGAGLFEVLGLKPLAGRFFGAHCAADQLPSVPLERDLSKIYRTVINETAARALGYSSPTAAVGGVFTSLTDVRAGTRREIIGVVADFASDSVRVAISPALYDDVDSLNRLNVRLRAADVPRTLRDIDALWQRLRPLPAPISRRFYDADVEELYRSMMRQGTLFAAFSALALLLAAMGLFGLVAFTVERRVREIGIRKALGADTYQVSGLVMWEFAKPVLAANLLAWPIGGWLMSRWLRGFAYHIDLPLWLFPASAAAALVIALLNVGGHALRVARASPMKVLRDE